MVAHNGTNHNGATPPLAGFAANKGATDQTGISAAGFTKVTFGTEAFDIGGFFDTTNSRWVPPIGRRVVLCATVTFASVDDGACQCAIYKNNALLSSGSFAAQSSNAGRSVATVIDNPNGTDYYEVFVFAGATGTFDVSGVATATVFSGSQL